MNIHDRVSIRMATALVHRAARHAPASLTERLQEEWLADLASQPTAFGRLRFAFGCCWAQQVISRDPVWSRASVGRLAGTHGAIATAVPSGPSPLSRRTIVLFIIVALHLAVALAFVLGVAPIPTKAPPSVIAGTFISRKPPRQAPPPIVKPTLEQIHSVDPIVHGPINFPQVIEYSQEPVASTPARDHAAPIAVTRLPGGPGVGFPSTADYYPASSIRLEETGVTAIQVCVDGKGRLTSDPTLATSSGSSRLDGGALSLARAGSGHFRSATEDGHPVSACFPIRIRFALSH
jgi:TonB family protein